MAGSLLDLEKTNPSSKNLLVQEGFWCFITGVKAADGVVVIELLLTVCSVICIYCIFNIFLSDGTLLFCFGLQSSLRMQDNEMGHKCLNKHSCIVTLYYSFGVYYFKGKCNR